MASFSIVVTLTALWPPYQILLVGETGTGKTSVVQALAKAVGVQLVVQNLNIQSDASDLLGGYRPVSLKQLAAPLFSDFISYFQQLFSQTVSATAFLQPQRLIYVSLRYATG